MMSAPSISRIGGLRTVIVLFLATLARGQSEAPAATSLLARGSASVAAIAITVDDADRSIAFYTGVLGFTLLEVEEASSPENDRAVGVFAARTRTARLALGREIVELVDFLGPDGRTWPEASRSNDLWFQHLAIVVSDMDRAYARLREARVAHISPEPQRIPDTNLAASGIRAFYFRDPDGHPLELIWFPAGRGDARWQEKSEALFLGIDHTAIAVQDTARSLAWYVDRLGFRVAGESENHGPEQERLSGVVGARVRITGLRLPGGPGVELLEYLEPGPGRNLPFEAQPNDLVHYRVRILDAPDAIEGTAPPRRHLRDPDGHAIEIVRKEGAR